MKKRTSSMSRRIVSLLMSMVLTLTLVTPAAFATEVVAAAARPSSRAIRTRLTLTPAGTTKARTTKTRTPSTAGMNSLPTPVMRTRTPARVRTMSTRLPMKPILRRAKALIPPWLPSAR